MLGRVEPAHRHIDRALPRTTGPDGVPDRADVREVLERVLLADGFSGSEKLSAFLRYIVNQTLEGHGERIKGYTVAVEALGHGPDHDPQADPTVRVLAGRLRQALALYFTGPGRDEPLRIEVPKGGYVPEFVRASKEERASSAGAEQLCSTCSGPVLRPNMDVREAELLGTRTCVFNRIAAMAARLTTASSALITMCERDSIKVIGRYGMANETYGLDFTFRGRLDPAQAIHVIEDVSTHPALAGHPIQNFRPAVRSLVVAPIPNLQEQSGALLVIDPSTEADITFRHGTLLCDLAALASAEIKTVDLLSAA